MNKKIKLKVMALTILAALLILASAGLVLAEVSSYTLSWSGIDGGGGTSSGASYTLSGSAGQADAGILSGQNYTVEGGFWPAISNHGPEPDFTLFLPLINK